MRERKLAGLRTTNIYDEIKRKDLFPDKPKSAEKDQGGILGGLAYVGGKIGTGLASIGEGITDFVGGTIADLTGNERKADYIYGRSTVGDWNESLDSWYNPSTGWKVAGDIGSGFGQSVGYVGISLIPYVGQAAATTAMITSATGNAVSDIYRQTGKRGVSEYSYAALTGLTEAALERYLGSTLKAGGRIAGQGLSKMTGKTAATTASRLGKSAAGEARKGFVRTVFTDAAGEAAEEFASTFTDYAWRNITGVDPNAKFSFQDALYQSFIGFASGGLMGGVSTGIRNGKNYRSGVRIAENGNAQTLLNTANYVERTLGLDEMQASSDKNVRERVSADLSQLNNARKAYEALAKEGKADGAKGKMLLGEMQESIFMIESRAKAFSFAETFAEKVKNDKTGEVAQRYAKVASAITGMNVTAYDVKNNARVIGDFGVMDVLGMTKLVGQYVADEKARAEYIEREILNRAAEKETAIDFTGRVENVTENVVENVATPTAETVVQTDHKASAPVDTSMSNMQTEMEAAQAEEARQNAEAMAEKAQSSKTAKNATEAKEAKKATESASKAAEKKADASSSLASEGKEDKKSVESDTSTKNNKKRVYTFESGSYDRGNATIELTETDKAYKLKVLSKDMYDSTYFNVLFKGKDTATISKERSPHAIRVYDDSIVIYPNRMGQPISFSLVNDSSVKRSIETDNASEMAKVAEELRKEAIKHRDGENATDEAKKAAEEARKASEDGLLADKPKEQTAEEKAEAERKAKEAEIEKAKAEREENQRRLYEAYNKAEKQAILDVDGFLSLPASIRHDIVTMYMDAAKYDGITPAQKKAIAGIMATRPGMRVYFSDQLADNGGYVPLNGNRVIVVNPNKAAATDAVIHEITHDLQLEGSPAYKKLASYIMKIADEKDVQKITDAYMVRRLNELGIDTKGMTIKECREAMQGIFEQNPKAAKGFEAMIKDEIEANLVAKTIRSEKLVNKIAKGHRPLLMRALARVHQLYSSVFSTSAQREIRKVEKLWTTAIFKDATEAKSFYKAMGEWIEGSKEQVRHSYSSIVYSFFGDESGVSVEDMENGAYKKTEGYKKYVNECLNNMRQSVPNFNEKSALKEIRDSIDGIVKVAVAMKNAGYDILDTEQGRGKKDSKNRLLFSSLEPNSDYFTSSDISTICDKRLNFQEIYDEIVRREESMGVPNDKRFFNNVDNYFVIHKILADKGLTAPCRQCYVESMRKNLAPMAKAFIELVQETDPGNKANKQLWSKGQIKSNNAKIREKLLDAIEREEYDIKVENLTVETLSTADGLATLKIQAPLIYEYFNSFYGQSKPKMPKSATPFRFGELTALLTNDKGEINTRLLNKIRSTGGFRLQSYSDFQIQNFADVLQVIFEAGTLGLNGHAYTKVPAFLDATKGTNLKRNISIFMYNDGGKWKLDRGDSFPLPLDQIYEIVEDDKTGNTGIIAVAQNADMAAFIMANDQIGYFIPFHKSGVKMGTVRETVVKDHGREIKGYSNIKDHTRQQTEVWARSENGHKARTKVTKPINIYEFWDFKNNRNLSRNELIEKNVKKYIDACNEAGYLPKFREYVMNNGEVLDNVLSYAKELGYASQDATIDDISFEYSGYRIPYGYYKCLVDFGVFTPDGKASPIETLSLKNYDFDGAVEFFADAMTLRRNEILQQFENGEERERFRNSDMTVAELTDEIARRRGDVVDKIVGRRSIDLDAYTRERDADYMNAVENGDMEKAQRMVDEAAKKAMPNSKLVLEDGNLRKVYHGTNTGDFYVFDPNYIGTSSGDDGFFGKGFYFAYSKKGAKYYGSKRIISAFVNVENPFDFRKELQTWNGQRAESLRADNAVAFLNFARKFPETAKDATVSVLKKGSDEGTSISLVEFADAYQDVIENKKIKYENIQNEFGEKETLVLADGKKIEYEYNGKTHSYIDYGFKERFWGDVNPLDVAYEYLSSYVYDNIDLYSLTKLILDHNDAFTEELKKRRYDGVIESEYGAEVVVFESSQIKSADPVTYDDDGNVIPLSQRFNPEKTDIRYSINLDLSDRILTTEKERSTFEKAKDTIGDIRNRGVKALASEYKESAHRSKVKVQVQTTNAQAGIEDYLHNAAGYSTDTVEVTANTMRAARNKGQSAITVAQTDFDGNIVGRSLNDIVKGVRHDPEFSAYMVHKLNASRAARNANVFLDVSMEDSLAAIADIDKRKPEFKKVSEELSKYDENVLKLAVDARLISKEQAEAYHKANPFYFPVMRVKNLSAGEQKLFKSNTVRVKGMNKAAKGGEADIVDPITALAWHTQSVYASAYTNAVAVAMYNAADGDLVRKATDYVPDFESGIDDEGRDTALTRAFNQGIDPKSDTLVFYEDGKAKAMRLAPEIMEGFKALRGKQSLYFDSALGKANTFVMRTFSKLVTTWNPIFLIRNAARDFSDAGMYSRFGMAKFVKTYFGESIKEISTNGKYWQEYVANGGFSVSIQESDIGKGDTVTKHGLPSSDGNVAQKAWQKYENAQLLIEQLPRFTEFMLSRKEGNNVQTSLYYAADVTVNFARGGTLTKAAGRTVIPFLNPAVQGFSRTARLIKDAAHDKRAAKRLIWSAAVLGIVPMLLNNMLYADDEDYEIIDDNVKANYYLIKMGDGKFIRIPKGRIASAFSSVTNVTQAQVEEGEFDSQRWLDALDNILSNSTPMDSVTRTIFSPILRDVPTNTTWYGGKIESQAYDHVAPGERYDEYTSGIAKFLGKTFNYSPLKIDYVLEQYSGVIGDILLPLTAEKSKTGNPAETLFTSIITDSTYSNNLSERFYDLYDEIDWDEDTLENYQLKKHLDQVKESVSQLYDDIDKLNEDDTLTEDERAEQAKVIRALINRTYKTALDDIDLMREAAKATDEAYTGVYNYTKVTESNYKALGLDKDDIGTYAVTYTAGNDFLTLQTKETEEKATDYIERTQKKAMYADMVLLTYGAEAALKAYSEDLYEKATIANALGVDYGTMYSLFSEIRYMTGSQKKERVNEILRTLPVGTGVKYLLRYFCGDTTKATKIRAANAIKQANIDQATKTELVKKLVKT